MGKKVVHFEILGKDGKKLQNFYSKLFDWKVDANNPMNYGIVTPADAGIGGGIAAGMDGTSQVTVYVEVEDLPRYLKKAESLGSKTIMPPMDVPGGPTIAMFADPEGHAIGLIKAGSGPKM
ncbi:MAG: glyoxalase [Chloroflexi bacterium]|nr:glyoxalase [Chloroflexota bacterium]